MWGWRFAPRTPLRSVAALNAMQVFMQDLARGAFTYARL